MDIFYYKKEKETDYYIKKSLERLGKDTSLWRENGKPFAKDCFIGVTHTDDFILVAVADFDFGIDCENLNRLVSKRDRIVDKYFTENERAYINDDNARFLEIWVKKEAYTKYTGEGLGGMGKVDVFKIRGYFTKLEFGENLIYIYSDRKAVGDIQDCFEKWDIKNT